MIKTASDLKNDGWPREEMSKYSPWESLERHEKDRNLLDRRDRAMLISRRIAGLLKEKYEARRVVLFGSLAHRAWFTPRSDIDICAEGIPPARFFHAESEIQGISEGFKVDLVDPQECSQELQREIKEEGTDL